MNAEIRKNAKNDFYKLMPNACFGKTMENVRNHRDIRVVTDGIKRNKMVRQPNYHTTKWFSEKLIAIEIKKNINKKE